MQEKNLSDETLVMLTLAGDTDAYNQLITRHHHAVFVSAVRITGNNAMAEDAVQDAFVLAWMKLNTLRQPEKFGAWVCRISRNCALNILAKDSRLVTLDQTQIPEPADFADMNPEFISVMSEEKAEIQTCLEQLPKKSREVVRLHYFEELSVSQIAAKLRISEGTVKWHLFDGRKRIRNALCAIDNRYHDTLIHQIRKKLDVIMLWQVKNEKDGFEAVYKNLLHEVEEMPEAAWREHALADILMHGWWWIPGKKNDALLERIRNAAVRGKNEEVISFILLRERAGLRGKEKIAAIRERQIPFLEENGFRDSLGREWFWLGYAYFRSNQPENGRTAYETARQYLPPSHALYALIPYAQRFEQEYAELYQFKPTPDYRSGVYINTLRLIDHTLHFISLTGYSFGGLDSIDREIFNLFRNSSRCDGRFFDVGLSVGESVTGSDGSELIYAAEDDTLETPAGRFIHCQLWVTRYMDPHSGLTVSKSWYCPGIGLVRHEHTADALTDVRVLKSCHMAGGSGLLPLEKGNRWEYADPYHPEVMRSELVFSVEYADGTDMQLACRYRFERFRFDENSWSDMMDAVRHGIYHEHQEAPYKNGILHALSRAGQLAATNMQIIHTKAAASAAGHMLAAAQGDCWSFFSKSYVYKKDGALLLVRNPRWSFEKKRPERLAGEGKAVLYHDIYGILQDAAGCIWQDTWQIGASPLAEYERRQNQLIQTKMVCEDAGTVTTAAGVFDNCMKLTLETCGLRGGMAYRGGRSVYIFASGIGIVRTEHEIREEKHTAIYELCAYRRSGAGWMPIEDGLVRQYKALGLPDGYAACTTYTYVRGDDGQIAVLRDSCGIFTA